MNASDNKVGNVQLLNGADNTVPNGSSTSAPTVPDLEVARLKAMPFDKDQRAWELAKVAAEPNEEFSATVQRAQRIKETL